MIQKHWDFFVLTLIFSAAIFAAYACFVRVFTAFFGIILLVLNIAWGAYFCSLKYSKKDDEILLCSGIVFGHSRKIFTQNILWNTQVIMPFSHKIIMTVLHTAGGRAVIFGEIV